MQTLNVSAGRTEEEYKADEERRRAELRDDIRADANYFFWAAGLVLLGSGLLLPVRLMFLVNVGAIDLLYLYGHAFGRALPLLVVVLSAGLVAMLTLLGVVARQYKRWPFWVGLILYAADMLALMVMFSLWALGVHAFFLMKWYQGQRDIAELRDSAAGLRPASH